MQIVAVPTESWKSLWSIGIGKPVGNNILPLTLPFVFTALLANVPQIIISYLYLMFNGLFTCMLAGM